MTRCIDEIELVGFTILRCVVQGYALGLDGNAPFTFDIHGIEYLRLHFPVLKAAAPLTFIKGGANIVVAVAGAANGSPLADDVQAAYRDYGATFPLSGCAAGTGEEVSELRRDVRLEWWRQHGEAVTVPVFALVAAPRPDHVSLATRATYRWLAQIDPRNDGRLLWHDQIPPRSYLLGYANADHSSIAVPVAQAFPSVAFLFRDDVPRTALIEAAIEVVAGTLASRGPQ